MDGNERNYVRPLPLLVRAWARTRAIGAFRGQARIGVGLVRRFVKPAVPYETPGGFALCVDPEDYFEACMMLGLYDPTGVALAREYVRPGSTVIDAGAHLGYFTLHLAHLVGQGGAVYAFECDPRAAERLRGHLRLNRCGWVRVVEAAVSDGRHSELTLRLTDQLGWSTVKPRHWVAGAHEVIVASTSLDEYLESEKVSPQSLSFIKLDVEGAELEALYGLVSTLRRSSAAVLVEFYPERLRALGQEPQEVFEVMATYGYRGWINRGGRTVNLLAADPAVSGDVLFLKRHGPPARTG
jgi:FkbM family methyltransferase